MTTIVQIRIAIRFHKLSPRFSSWARILTPTKAIITTAVAWIAMVNAMSDRPQRQLGWSNISIKCVPQIMASCPLFATLDAIVADQRATLASHVRFGSKADMCSALADVRFTPESGHVLRN